MAKVVYGARPPWNAACFLLRRGEEIVPRRSTRDGHGGQPISQHENLNGAKVVARYASGRIVKGYTYDFRVSRRWFHLFADGTAAGEPTRILLKELKAVFCVRDFAGDPRYRERKRFDPGQPAKGHRAEITFTDGEVLIGSVDAYDPEAIGFFFFPADPDCNNLKVFVIAAAVRRIRPLSDSPPRRAPAPDEPGQSLAIPKRLLSWLSRGGQSAPSRVPTSRETPLRASTQPGPPPAQPPSSGNGRGTRVRLLDLLVKEGRLTVEQAHRVLAEQRRTPDGLARVLERLDLMRERELLDFLSRRYRLPVIELQRVEISEEITRLVRKEVVQKHRVLPVRKVGNALTLALADPTDMTAIDDVRFATGLDVITVLASETAIREAIERHYTEHPASRLDEIIKADQGMGSMVELVDRPTPRVDVAELGERAGEAPVVRLVNLILADAINRRASDIHLEPDEDVFRVRYRIDGVLHDVMTPPRQLEPAILSRVKIMANLDIAERRLPQDGRLSVTFAGKEVDLRVSSLPTTSGEKLVMRILDKSGLVLDLQGLGLEEDDLERFGHAIQQPHGMILATGPTGSGKSTTLYAAVSAINSAGVNILSAEEPVEYNLRRINQVAVREDLGLSFTALLRAFLRQDPDVILVGEMRDTETAQIAIRAALTGHLVLSTLHTNDAAGAVTRLIDMGIPPYLLTSSLIVAVAQRLCRRICVECSEPAEVPLPVLLDVGFKPEEAESVKIHRGRGCSACANSGYRGRIAIHEMLFMSPELQQVIVRQGSAAELKLLALKQGMRTLREAGLMKVKRGLTTLDEVLRVTSA